MGDPGAGSLLRLASWALGIGGLLLLLVMLDRLLSEEMLDVGYSLLTLQVTSPVRYSVLKALSCLPALALLLIPALIFLFIPLPGLAPIPALFCGYFGCLGLFSLLLIRLGKMPGVTGSLSFSAANPNLRRVLTGLGSFAAVLLISLMLHFSGLYTLRFSLDRLPAFLLCGAPPPPWAPPDGSTMPCCWISANSRFPCGSAWNCCPSCPMRVWPSWQFPPSDSPASTP